MNIIRPYILPAIAVIILLGAGFFIGWHQKPKTVLPATSNPLKPYVDSIINVSKNLETWYKYSDSIRISQEKQIESLKKIQQNTYNRYVTNIVNLPNDSNITPLFRDRVARFDSLFKAGFFTTYE